MRTTIRRSAAAILAIGIAGSPATSTPQESEPTRGPTIEATRFEVQRAHSGRVLDLTVTPGDRSLISTDATETKVWDVATGLLLGTIASPGNVVEGGVVAPRFLWKSRDALVVPNSRYIALHDPRTLVETASVWLGCEHVLVDDAGERIYGIDMFKEARSLQVFELYFPKRRGLDNERVYSIADFFTGRGGIGQVTRLGGGRFLVSSADAGEHRVIELAWKQDIEPAVPLGRRHVARASDGNVYTFGVEERPGADLARIERRDPRTLAVTAETSFDAEEDAGDLVARSRDFVDRDGRLLLRTRHEFIDIGLTELDVVARRKTTGPGGEALEATALLAGDEAWFGSSGGAISRGVGDGTPRLLARRTIAAGPLVAAPTGETLYLGDRRITLRSNGLALKRLPFRADEVAFSADGKLAARLEKGPSGKQAVMGAVSALERAALRYPSEGLRGDANRVLVSPTGRYLLFLSASYGASLVDTELDEIVHEFRDVTTIDDVVATPFSPDETKLILRRYDGVRCVSIASGDVLWTAKTNAKTSSIRFLGNPIVQVVDDVGDDLYCSVRDAGTGEELLRWLVAHFPPDAKTPTATSADGRRMAGVSINQLKVWDLATGEELLSLWTRTRPASMAFLPDSRHLAVCHESGVLQLFDVDARRAIADIAVFDDDEWIVAGADARFTSSPGAASRMAFVRDGIGLPLESLFERFHTPNLIGELFARAPVEEIVVPEIAAPPEVHLALDGKSENAAEARLVARVIRRGTDVNEVRLYHNGKLVQQSTRGLTVEDDTEDESESLHRWIVPLILGENEFRAVAIDTQRTESLPATLALVGPKESEAPAGIRLHVVVVGINAYKNPKYALNYALDDARAFREALATRSAPIVSDVVVHELYDARATRSGILAALQTVKRDAGKNDVFVFYYAGHGVMSSGADARFFLVPQDVTQLYGDDAALARNGVSSEELRGISMEIPAQKQLFILDACQSAGALLAVATRGAAEERAIAQLARSTGTHWLTASGSDQFATEVEALGHGVFTYVLLAAMSGEADTGDGRVTVNELKAFLESRVPEVSQQHKGTTQFPASFGYGQDFPLGVTKP